MVEKGVVTVIKRKKISWVVERVGRAQVQMTHKVVKWISKKTKRSLKTVKVKIDG